MVSWQPKTFTASLLTPSNLIIVGHAVFHSAFLYKPCCSACRVRYNTVPLQGRFPSSVSSVRSVVRPCSLTASFPPAVLNGVGGSGIDVELCERILSVACSSSSAHSGIMRAAFRRGFVIEMGIGGYLVLKTRVGGALLWGMHPHI